MTEFVECSPHAVETLPDGTTRIADLGPLFPGLSLTELIGAVDSRDAGFPLLAGLQLARTARFADPLRFDARQFAANLGQDIVVGSAAFGVITLCGTGVGCVALAIGGAALVNVAADEPFDCARGSSCGEASVGESAAAAVDGAIVGGASLIGGRAAGLILGDAAPKPIVGSLGLVRVRRQISGPALAALVAARALIGGVGHSIRDTVKDIWS